MSGILGLRRVAFSRLAVAAALASAGLVAAAPLAHAADKAAKPAGKVNYSKPFVAAAGPVEKAIADASKNPEISALTKQIADSKDPAQQAALRAQVLAKVPGLAAQVDAAGAAASTPDDKFAAGNFYLNLGILTQDSAVQMKGLKLMADSGRLTGDMVGKVNFNLGALEFNAKDYASARTHLKAALDAGYPQPDLAKMVADTYFRANDIPGGLAILQSSIDGMIKANQPVPASYYLSGLAWASKAKDMAALGDWSAKYVTAVNTPKAWNDALINLAVETKYEKPEMLDLLRLMSKAGAMTDARSYYEYIDDADARSLPGEVIRVVNQGRAAGILKSSDVNANEAFNLASGRVAADKASLPALATKARAAANGVTALATADAYLGHGDAKTAVDLYNVALSKGGVDANRAQTRLGIALIEAGDLAGAKAAFAKVTGARLPLAKLWLAYLATKGA